MANVTFTATAIKEGANAQTAWGFAGEAVTRGQAVYQLSTDNEYYAADATNAAKDAAVGFALNDAADGQKLKVIKGGNMTCDGLTAGKTYVLHTAGLIQDISGTEPAIGDYVTVMGAASSATNLVIPVGGPVVTAYLLA